MSEEEKEEHQSLLEVQYTIAGQCAGNKEVVAALEDKKEVQHWETGREVCCTEEQHGTENNKVKTVEGVVTKAFSDHGWIDDSIFFHYENVTGDLPLRIGQRVVAVVEEHETSLGWKAIKSVAVLDFEPYEGDLMEVVFSFKTEMQDRKIISVKPLRYSHVKQVFITSMCGRDGVVDNNIFFTLDSLKIPAGYVPQLHDLVNVLVVQSTQPSYCWRAISMTPVHME
ncbi:cancer/testis antigen 55-like [Perognathus longimembris pacificus]|uniref:cancer/testis antigen 55-like n=1 Tax=Perognathus longimembris pacificus TaxID=214514 RepID=UPI002018D6AF|nr:cancer/testis antigen 55-like [Perognathus longimembris pacificus]